VHGVLLGQTPTSAGVTSDDGWSGVRSIGFTYHFYGSAYTQCLIGSNGAVSFNTSLAGGGFGWSITSALLGNAAVRNCVCGPWCDIYIPAGGTITYSTVGTAPNRKFVVTWCHTRMYSCTTQWTTTQIILYETSDLAEVHIGHKTVCSWNGGYAIVGVQNAAGSAATAAPSRDYPTVWSATNEGWRFTPNSAGTAYSVASISYAPVPYSSSSIYYWDSASRAYLGTGDSVVVCDSVAGRRHTVMATAYGCDDTTYAYIDATPLVGSPVHITYYDSTNPTVCGRCDGTIKLVGVNPFQSDSVYYSINGVPQTMVVMTAGADSTLTFTGLCAGTYDYFYVKVGQCPSNTVGPIHLVDPPFTISSFTFTQPTICGACDGTITIYGLVPGYTDTVNYSKGGVPQTPVIATVGGSGTITITGLSAGNYTNITAKMNNCVTPPVGPIRLTDPPFGIADTSSTNASCSACDGTITLKGLTPSQSITVNYDYNGVPQAPLSFTSTSAGTVTLTSLCPGTYNNITATLNSCVAGACISSPVGTFTIVPPPLIPIRVYSVTDPTECGACNGLIKIIGVTPFSLDTIFYTLNGVAQPPIIASAAFDSTVTLFNLCEGRYSDFFIKVGPCPTTTIRIPVNLVDPPIVAGFTTVVKYGCIKDTVIFNNTSTSPGALWYVWRFGDGTTDITANPIHVYPQGTYVVTLLATNHHCTDSVNATIPLLHPIQAIFTTNDSIFCQGKPVTFNNTSVGTPPTFQWSFGDGNSAISTNPAHTYANVGQYDVRLIATNFVPCSDTAYTHITIDSQTVMSMTVTDSAICRGTYVTLNSTFTNLGYTGMVWNLGNGDSIKNVNPLVYSYLTAGNFTITATANYRRCDAASVTHNISVYPTPEIDLGPDTSICLGSEPITIGDYRNPAGAGTYWYWNTGSTNNAITVGEPGVYYATVTVNKCQATDSVRVTSNCYLSVPNGFSPDGDGVNDYFNPRDLLGKGLSTFEMTIYNRWGQVVFKTANLDGRGWDGKYNGVQQPQGVYVYVIEASFKDGQKETHKGNVTLLR
jgi:gliding motility-associated-like protein